MANFPLKAQKRRLWLGLLTFVIHSALAAIWNYSGLLVLSTFASGAIIGSLVAVCAWTVFSLGPLWLRLLNLTLFVTTALCGVATIVGPQSWNGFAVLPVGIFAGQIPMWMLRIFGWRLQGPITSLAQVKRLSIGDLLAATALSAVVIRGATLMSQQFFVIPIFMFAVSGVVAIPGIFATLVVADLKKGLRGCALYLLLLCAALTAFAVHAGAPIVATVGICSSLFGICSVMIAVFFVLRYSGYRLLRHKLYSS